MSRQRLGQHFLTSGPLLERIAVAACPDPCELVIEIGPGRGALTEKLLERAKRVVSIELDPGLAESLKRRFPDRRLEVIPADILAVELGRWGGAPFSGNLPYYIASAIIEKVARLRPPRAVFLVQKEVADRLTAKPGSRNYGFLSVRTAVYATARQLFDVKPGAFRPPPKVDSAVVLLEPRSDELGVPDAESFVRFAGRAFRHKRKTIRNNLHDIPGIAEWPEAGMRAEQLSIQQFAEMYRRIAR